MGGAARASTRPTRRNAGWCSRWRPTSSGRRWSTPSAAPTGRPIRPWPPTPVAAPRTTLLDERLGTWAAEIDLDKAVDLLVGAGIPAAPAYDARRTSEHPQFVARDYYEQLDHPIIGARVYPSLPFRYASVERWLVTPAPMLGQHNHEILTGLGLSDDEIAELEAADLIGTTPLGL